MFCPYFHGPLRVKITIVNQPLLKYATVVKRVYVTTNSLTHGEASQGGTCWKGNLRNILSNAAVNDQWISEKSAMHFPGISRPFFSAESEVEDRPVGRSYGAAIYDGRGRTIKQAQKVAHGHGQAQ